jgi:hypothetical protein
MTGTGKVLSLAKSSSGPWGRQIAARTLLSWSTEAGPEHRFDAEGPARSCVERISPVGTAKKSIEANAPRWLSRKVRQVCEGGLRFRLGMKRETLRSLMTMPSLSSSPWILGAPQPTLASAIRRMSCLTSAETSSFAGVRERDFHFQNGRKPARCQRTMVSGLTMTRASAHRDQT